MKQKDLYGFQKRAYYTLGHSGVLMDKFRRGNLRRGIQPRKSGEAKTYRCKRYDANMPLMEKEAFYLFSEIHPTNKLMDFLSQTLI
jgi:hypothetical protein